MPKIRLLLKPLYLIVWGSKVNLYIHRRVRKYSDFDMDSVKSDTAAGGRPVEEYRFTAFSNYCQVMANLVKAVNFYPIRFKFPGCYDK